MMLTAPETHGGCAAPGLLFSATVPEEGLLMQMCLHPGTVRSFPCHVADLNSHCRLKRARVASLNGRPGKKQE